MTRSVLRAPAGVDVPDLADILDYLRGLGKPTAAEVLAEARQRGTPAIQPRCGVGSQPEMLRLLQELEQQAAPDILTLTIDSHTRLLRFAQAATALAEDPARLNGYPLVAHGWRRGRELNEAVQAPLQVRHGSPDPRALFAVSIAAGITSFEGGGVSYNVPYVKDVPIADSLRCWQEVDQACGRLGEQGVLVERELFGTLTAVLMPPSISLAVAILEAVAAAAEGVRCVSLAYPQGGHAVQDVAALRAIPVLAARYLPAGVLAYPVLHQFMGAFPADPIRGNALILYGGLVAKWGGAAKVIVKTNQEALGIPDLAANVDGLRTTSLALSDYLRGFGVDDGAVAEEQEWIEREVRELVEPVLAEPDLLRGIADAFGSGRLDVPFSASIHAHGVVFPMRDPSGAIRISRPGRLPFSAEVLRRNEQLLRRAEPRGGTELISAVLADIEFFSRSA